jgi:hypothetical protein
MGGGATERRRSRRVILYFAYGSNMSRAVMGTHAPQAAPIGVAKLAHYRFVITPDGYASVAPWRTAHVYGVLWRLGPRDRVSLDAWENVTGGLYRARTLPVLQPGRRRMALVYLARPSPSGGQPRANYMELVIAAALEWHLPHVYTQSLRRWLPGRGAGAGARNLKEFRWT